MQERYIRKCLQRLVISDKWKPHSFLTDDIFNDILLNSGLLFQEHIGEPIRFFHPTFQEYFAARFVVSRWEKTTPLTSLGYLTVTAGNGRMRPRLLVRNSVGVHCQVSL